MVVMLQHKQQAKTTQIPSIVITIAKNHFSKLFTFATTTIVFMGLRNSNMELSRIKEGNMNNDVRTAGEKLRKNQICLWNLVLGCPDRIKAVDDMQLAGLLDDAGGISSNDSAMLFTRFSGGSLSSLATG